MDNKKYLDKVIGSLVRGTKIDYDEGRIYAPFSPFPFLSSLLSYFSSTSSFSKYCKNTFGLTEEEIKYVWNQYRSIIKNKIDSGE